MLPRRPIICNAASCQRLSIDQYVRASGYTVYMYRVFGCKQRKESKYSSLLTMMIFGKIIILTGYCYLMITLNARIARCIVYYRFRLRFRPRPREEAYSAPPEPLAGFKGPTSKVRGRKMRRGEGPPLCVGMGPQMVNPALKTTLK